MDKAIDVVALREAPDFTCLVLAHSPPDAVSHADVDIPTTARNDIHEIRMFFHRQKYRSLTTFGMTRTRARIDSSLSLTLPLLHQLHKIPKQIIRIMRSRRRLRMVLHAE